ncbi:HupE/UreJ family protein [Portibacter lacus]|uniref:HupE / UreJ protein n=1 Tax=Portibacter lacus TaxID=1099794 RepID=A0AA37SQ30_9BACT|nr:HupE/UreJ family protein [Portibacter lacus]GLR17154.1 hypothetical protein GCM10007940_17690 [Portibacter lacus]
MSDFSLYLQLGLEHIADFAAYDHMIFIISLCAIFLIKDWRKVLILVTAFTIGHSITLALSVLDLINIDKDLIETLIPITILITSIINIVLVMKKKSSQGIILHYALALFFGLIHGMGFANYLKSLLGGMQSVTMPLLAFNIGIELGQIGIVIVYFLIYDIIRRITNLQHKFWVIIVSSITALISLSLILGI